jgi:hypothetical protein
MSRAVGQTLFKTDSFYVIYDGYMLRVQDFSIFCGVHTVLDTYMQPGHGAVETRSILLRTASDVTIDVQAV